MPRYTRRRLVATGIGLATIGSLAGCLSNDAGSNDSGGSEPEARSSFFVFGDLASQVAGDTATAETLVPIGQHGHGWEPVPQIQGTVPESDLFLYGMDGFQPWADDLVTSLRDDDTDVEIVSAGAGIELIEGSHDHGHEEEHEGEHEEGHEGEDEHGHVGETPWEWAGLYHLEAGSYTYTFHEGPDPEMQLAVIATEESGDIDSDNASTYAENAEAYSDTSLAILAAEFAAIAGVTLSYVHGIAAGGSIVVAAIGVYVVALSSRKLIHRLPTVQRLGNQRHGQIREGLEADGGERE